MRSIFEKLVLSNKWAVLQVVFPHMFDNIIARHFLRFVDQMYRRTSVLPHISVMSNKCEIPAGVIMVLFSYESFLSLTWNSHQNCKKNYFAAGRMRKFLPHPHSGNTTFFYFRLTNLFWWGNHSWWQIQYQRGVSSAEGAVYVVSRHYVVRDSSLSLARSLERAHIWPVKT